MRRRAAHITRTLVLLGALGCFPFTDVIRVPIDAMITREDDVTWRIEATVPAQVLQDAARESFRATLSAWLTAQHGGVFVRTKHARITIALPDGQVLDQRTATVRRGPEGVFVDLFDVSLDAVCADQIHCEDPVDTDTDAHDTDLPLCTVQGDCTVRRIVRVERGDRAGRLWLDGAVSLSVGSFAPFDAGLLDLDVSER